MRTNEIKNEFDEIKKQEEKNEKNIQNIKQKNYTQDFHTRKARIVEVEEDQSNLLKNIVEFNNKFRPITKKGKDKKGDIYESAQALYEGREVTLNAFKSEVLPKKTTQGEGKILNPKQMLQRLLIVLAQVKAGTASENLLNEIRQIIYSLY